MKNKRAFFALATALLLIIISFSCNKDDKDTQPDLPPIEALSMDFSDFTTFPDTAPDIKSAGYYTNFAYSFANVFLWNGITTAVMIIPVTAYAECLNHTPQYLGDNSWQWSYSVSIMTITLEAKLITKRIDNETFSAKMYITNSGNFEDFLWFEGTVRYDRTHALWTMYESPANNVEWLSIEWTKDWEAGTSSLIYTIEKAGHPEEGGYISFGIVEDTAYDTFYSISGSQVSIEIKYNTETHAGRVQSADVFGNTDWHCWDATFMNVDCN